MECHKKKSNEEWSKAAIEEEESNNELQYIMDHEDLYYKYTCAFSINIFIFGFSGFLKIHWPHL